MTTINFEREKFFIKLIWLFPIVYVFHIMEESNGFANWVTNVLGGQMTLKPFLINNSIFMVVLLALCFVAKRQKKMWSTFLLFFWVSAQEFWNFIFHIYTQFQFKAYSPGYFTAILLYLPVYSYLSYICLVFHGTNGCNSTKKGCCTKINVPVLVLHSLPVLVFKPRCCTVLFSDSGTSER